MGVHPNQQKPILVLGGTGKTGRRVAERLTASGLPVRIGSRSGQPSFDWSNPATWTPALDDVGAVYIAYYPDVAAPGGVEAVSAFANVAVANGVRRLVLLSGRGEPESEEAEAAVRASGADLTILRATWFAQNFSEGYLRDPVLGGAIALPAGDVREPIVDVDDIAEVAVAALTEARHGGELYEITGPRLLHFSEVAAELAAASGQPVEYVPITLAQFHAAMTEIGGAFIADVFTHVCEEALDGRNEWLGDGVQRALGRAPRDFSEFCRRAAAAGAWRKAA